MPLYDYECPVCHETREVLEMPGDKPFKKVCLTCLSIMKRVMPSRVSFRLIPGPAGFWSSHGYADRITPENDTSIM